MVEKMPIVRYTDIRVAVPNAALNSFNKVLLANHIRTYLCSGRYSGKEKTKWID